MKQNNGITYVKDWILFFAPLYCALTVAVGMVLRTVLLCNPITQVQFSAGQWVAVFGLGLLNDLAFSVLALAPAMVVSVLLTPRKYQKPYWWIMLALLAALWIYTVLVPDNLWAQYGGGAPVIAAILSSLLLIPFALCLAFPRLQQPFREAVLYGVMFLYLFFLLFNAVGEWFFWAEFGSRYNFVAVDYLVYTHEVVGNIMESYSVVPLLIGAVVLTAGLLWFSSRWYSLREARCPYILTVVPCYAVLFLLSLWWLHFCYWNLKSENAFVSELQENGCYDFIEAFQANELDYEKFYEMLPPEECQRLRQELCQPDSASRTGTEPMGKHNIVLVMVESLSADYLTAYGETRHLTPHLDSIMGRSLVFDSLFAAGNRSVRGLEAVTLCIPPSAGGSLIKRPEQPRRVSTGSLLSDCGYTTMFIYGGNSYFDNMGPFFRANGYEVVDAASFQPGEVTFKNIWGACDGDTYNMALRTFDEADSLGKPFFAHIMTISNHRPFTYPPTPGFEKGERSRAAGVRYTDYALGQFLQKASTKPWFDNTLFVIVADHCASSAGKTSLPLEKYHIPAIVYAPALVQPQRVEKVCSQIDLMPTVLGITGMDYEAPFAGRDIMADDFPERAFIATYQDLAYYRNGVLTILSPVKHVNQYGVRPLPDGTFEQLPLSHPDTTALRQAQAMYQWVNTEY